MLFNFFLSDRDFKFPVTLLHFLGDQFTDGFVSKFMSCDLQI